MLPYSPLFLSSSVRCLCSDQMNIDQIIFHQHNTTLTNLSSTPPSVFPPQIVNYKKQDSTKGEGAFLGEPDAMGYGEDQGQGLDGYGQSPARAFAYNGDGRGNTSWSEICFLLQPLISHLYYTSIL